LNRKDQQTKREVSMKGWIAPTWASFFFLLMVGGGVTLEGLNYLLGGPEHPGLGAEVGLITGAALALSIGGYKLARELVKRYKGTGVEGQQPSQQKREGTKPS
jgi:hypothetical protein